MREMTKDEFKKCLLDMMSYFHDVCEKNNIPYMLQSGSCLGAVRHNGFIPWDDDMDVAVERKYYDKLIEILEKSSEIYKVETDKNTKNRIYPFAKLIDSRTVVTGCLEAKSMGVFLDIFPIDGLPNKYRKMRRHIKKVRRCVFCIVQKKGYLCEPRPFMFFLKRFWGFVFPASSKYCLRKIDKLCKKYDVDSSAYVMDLSWGTKFYPRSCIKNVVLHEFEGRQFYIPKDYDIYLTCVYGDYQTIPPKEKQINHNIKAFFKD